MKLTSETEEPTPKEKLREAVEAMRNINGIVAAEWKRRYPTFSEAVDNSIFQPSGDPWDRQIAAMKTELQIRIAEFILS